MWSIMWSAQPIFSVRFTCLCLTLLHLNPANEVFKLSQRTIYCNTSWTGWATQTAHLYLAALGWAEPRRGMACKPAVKHAIQKNTLCDRKPTGTSLWLKSCNPSALKQMSYSRTYHSVYTLHCGNQVSIQICIFCSEKRWDWDGTWDK